MSPIQAGMRFARLTVLHETERARADRRWVCRCDCGKDTVVQAGNLRRGHTRSCGCLHRENARAVNLTHGLTRDRRISSEFTIWWGMIARCENENATNFADYGGRGIRVCFEWRESFPAFLRDMGARPSRKHSIERVNNHGDYEPDNCRWATQIEQTNNQRSNRLVTFGGETKTLAMWARAVGLNYKAVHARLRTGWSVERALSEPIGHFFSR